MEKIVLMVKRHGEFLSIFYNDHKHAIIKDDIRRYRVKGKKGYKRPIVINHCFLYPTKSIKDEDCIFVNIEMFVGGDAYYLYLLNKYGIYDKTKRMYLKYKC